MWRKERPKTIVASGKGGTGKTTIAVSTGAELANRGQKVAFIDLDVEGSNTVTLFGLEEQEQTAKDKIIPVKFNKNLKLISIASHPSIIKAKTVFWNFERRKDYIRQVMTNTDWGYEPDIYIFDSPPGVSDAILALRGLYKNINMVLVSQPNAVSVENCDAVIKIANKLRIPVLGLLQNFSVYKCPKCGNIDHIFGQDKAKELAEKYQIKFFGSMPIDSEIGRNCDNGKPLNNKMVKKIADTIIDVNKPKWKKVFIR